MSAKSQKKLKMWGARIDAELATRFAVWCKTNGKSVADGLEDALRRALPPAFRGGAAK